MNGTYRQKTFLIAAETAFSMVSEEPFLERMRSSWRWYRERFTSRDFLSFDISKAGMWLSLPLFHG
jgi:hypothetical protein